jgi:hypothetical protein
MCAVVPRAELKCVVVGAEREFWIARIAVGIGEVILMSALRVSRSSDDSADRGLQSFSSIALRPMKSGSSVPSAARPWPAGKS